MKFLILALCVCAASAAPQAYKPWQQAKGVAQADKPWQQAKGVAQADKPWQQTRAAAQAVIQPAAQPVAKATVSVVSSGSEAEAPILRSESDVTAEGYNYNYETGNGISAESSGSLKKVEDADVLIVKGSYQYTAPDGTPVQISYIADENGYQPQGDLLPVAPPVPEAIARSLKYLEEHPPPQETIVIAKKF